MAECDHTFTATLISILSVKEALNSEMENFVKVRAAIDKRKLRDEDKVAIFNIVSTMSYQVFFIDKEADIEKIKEEFNKMNVKLNYDSEQILKRYIERLKE
ncbi:Protein of unknown function DUF749 [Methanocaldococcus vulcanius M7]|uniref:DUF749 domain-containing protein n=1 Tax=Methanocaldococcus vulcanius (strain ATCC 700851 / DSM 12094 / M7) TaxID=579137 RepID=C9REZ0_METVM|nr:DUF749 domain-containing protein [Methanocaldococcus vulcanius]ACX72142.1 Protein of unknown function DUF749 [Methanocaldococcus vulcanius M7]